MKEEKDTWRREDRKEEEEANTGTPMKDTDQERQKG